MDMLLRRKNALPAAAVVLLLLGSPSSGQAQRSGTTLERPFDPPSSGQSTCPSRSINYITQTLPQQCLRTDWRRDTELPTPSSTPVQDNSEVFSSTTSGTQATTGNTSSEPQDPIEPAPSIGTNYSNHDPTTSTQPSIVPSSSSTTTIPSQHETTSTAAGDSDRDSPLDQANFLSFEEWKRQNLAKAGQSVDHVGTGRAGIGEAEHRRRPSHINNAFDSLGEDTEIEIDFGGFANPGVPSQAVPSRKASTDGGSESRSDQPGEDKKPGEMAKSHPRGRDAGKTCKERSNYASFDCAATVLKTNPECKGSNSVLVENKDSYMLNECSAKNKFFIVELCDDILIDTVVLANFEFFSSMFRTFKVSVSDKYPVKLEKWRELGTFEARNSREIQAFLIENPLIWARYIRVEFLTHFGNEYYCPVSLFRVHGTTMMEEFNHEVKSSIGEDDSEIDVGESEERAESEPTSRVVTADTLKHSSHTTSEKATPTVVDAPITSTEVSTITSQDTPSTNVTSTPEIPEVGSTPFNSSMHPRMESLFAYQVPSSSVCSLEDQKAHVSPTVPIPPSINGSDESTKVAQPTPLPTMHSPLPATANETSPDISNKSAENLVAIPPKISNSSNQIKTHSSSTSANQTSHNSTKSHPTPTHPSPASPTTQESFFKSVHKRLQLLESNSTLSLQYIEDQSRILRDAFSAVEKRQLAKTSTFLETLNSTVLTELRDFRNQYDQIWQSTVLELSAQRESSQHEVLALSARISLLADEVVFQKRIAILQFVLILLCLALVIFSRNGSATHYLDLPTLAINRSHSNLSGFGPHFDTPPSTRPSSRYGIFGRGNAHERSPSSPPEFLRPSSRYGIFGRGSAHERSPSEESTLDKGTKSPEIEYSPPTPMSRSTDARSNGKEPGEADEVLSEGSDDGGGSRKIHSSPATLGGQRSGRPALEGGGLLTPDPEPEPSHICDVQL